MTADLDEFFARRTIGFDTLVPAKDWLNGWTWRGPGYDEGWDDVTEEELRTLHRLLGEALSTRSGQG